jgi:hypothetical protein
MNAIIARKHIAENRNQLIPTGLIVSLERNPRPVVNYGLIDVKRGKCVVVKDGEKYLAESLTFLEGFKRYCTDTIYSEKNVVTSLH